MCSNDKIQFMAVEEFNYYVGTKGERNSPIVFSPSLFSKLGVCKHRCWFLSIKTASTFKFQQMKINQTLSRKKLTVCVGSGSDHSISHNNPVSGTSQGLVILLIWSNLLKWGLNPPCMQIILSSITAVHGKQLKVLQNCFHILTEKRRRHSS